MILDYKIRNSFSRTYIGRTELIHHQVRQQFLQNNKLVRVAFRQPYTLNQAPKNQRRDIVRFFRKLYCPSWADNCIEQHEVFWIRFLNVILGTLWELYACSESPLELYWNSNTREHLSNFSYQHFFFLVEMLYWITIVLIGEVWNVRLRTLRLRVQVLRGPPKKG